MNYKILTTVASVVFFSVIVSNAIYQSEKQFSTTPDVQARHVSVQDSASDSTRVLPTEKASANLPVFTSNAPMPPRRVEKALRKKSLAESTSNVRPAPSTPLQDQESGDLEQQNNLNALNNQFLAQSTDEQWSAQSTDQIYGYFNQSNQQPTGSHAELRSVECRSSLCRVEVVHDDATSADDFYLKFPQEVGEYLPSITYKVENLPDGKIDVLMFLASASFNDQ